MLNIDGLGLDYLLTTSVGSTPWKRPSSSVDFNKWPPNASKETNSSKREMSSSKSARRSASSHRSSIFPLPNATKPRYTVSRKLEFSELPDDILLAVFRYLSPIDLLNVGLVSRRWYAVSQDQSLWRILAHVYGLQQPASTTTAKQSIQTYLNQHIRNKLKSLFPAKFDPLRSYTGMADYQKTFQKLADPFHFLLAFCDERHQVIWSQKCDTMKLFDTSMSLRWFDLTMPQCLSRVQYLRLFAIVSIDMQIRPNRTPAWKTVPTCSNDFITLARIRIPLEHPSNESEISDG